MFLVILKECETEGEGGLGQFTVERDQDPLMFLVILKRLRTKYEGAASKRCSSASLSRSLTILRVSASYPLCVLLILVIRIIATFKMCHLVISNTAIAMISP